MILTISFGILLLITILALVLGNNFIKFITSIGIDNNSFVNGVSNSFVVNNTDVLFSIDSTQIGGAILILTVTMIALAAVLGITVLATGLNTNSIKTILYAVVLGGTWALLSTLSFPLIVSIEVFGAVIYILLTVGFVVGAFQLISGGSGGGD